jgi:hypothetical protein
MRRRFFVVVVLLLAGCAGQSFDLSEPEQHLIGRPDAQVLECMGPPKEKRGDGYTLIWVYDYGEGSNGYSQTCSLNVIFKGAYVSRVTSADASGGPLPQGQRCLPATLEWCARTAPTPEPSGRTK